MNNFAIPSPPNLEDGVFAPFNQLPSQKAPLPTPNPTKSFWLDSDPSTNPLKKVGSTGPLTQAADIVIIGSGITGCSAAYHLARLFRSSGDQTQSMSVVILEARDFCSGATGKNHPTLGRNGGHLTPVIFSEFRNQVKAHGVDEALRAVALEQHNASSILEFLDKPSGAAEEVDLVSGGHVALLFTPGEVEAARADITSAAEAGVDLSGVEWLEPEAMKERFRVQLPGIYWPGHNLWPLKLVTKLYEAAKGIIPSDAASSPKFSLELFTHTPVEAVEAVEAVLTDSLYRWSVKTGRGDVKARYVIHATNAYASHILPHLTGPANGIVPTRGQCIATRGSVEARKWPMVSWRANQDYQYWFSRPPKEAHEKTLVILGGGRNAVPSHEHNVADDSAVNPVISQVLRNFLPRLYPGNFEDVEPEMEWAGIMGFTASNNPMVGKVYAEDGKALVGQYIAAGYSGHGMPRAFACAEALAQMIYADMLGSSWPLPDWFPRHLLTTASQSG